MKLFIFIALVVYGLVTMYFWYTPGFSLREALQCAAPVVIFMFLIIVFTTSFEGEPRPSPLDDMRELED